MNRKKSRITALFLSLAVFLFLAGCTTMAPKYTRQEAPVPAEWPIGEAYSKGTGTTPGKTATDIPWQEFFVDAKLQKLIALALDNNRDLRIAALNIERSRALYQIERSDIFPAVNATGSEIRQRVPANVSATGQNVTFQQ